MWSELVFESHGLRLRAAVSAAGGPALVLLHGVTRCWRDWMPLAPALATRWQLFALDFRGHGGSQPAVDGAYRVMDYVQDAVGLIQARVRRPFIVLGHSLGALVAAAVAAELPDLAGGALLLDPPLESLTTELRDTVFYSQFAGIEQLIRSTRDTVAIARGLEQLPLSDPRTGRTFRLGDVRDAPSLRFYARCLSQMDQLVLAPLLAGNWMVGYDPDQIFARIDCPVLLLQADPGAGGMLSDEGAQRVARSLANCTHLSLPGAGHLLHWLDPVRTQIAILAFLESLPAADPVS